MNDLKLEVTHIIGESINGMSRVTLAKPAFDAIKQSNWAKYNKETPLLSFTPTTDETDKWVNVYTIQGIKVISYSDKESKKTLFFMNTKQAQACLVKDLALDISKFDLSVISRAVAA